MLWKFLNSGFHLLLLWYMWTEIPLRRLQSDFIYICHKWYTTYSPSSDQRDQKGQNYIIFDALRSPAPPSTDWTHLSCSILLWLTQRGPTPPPTTVSPPDQIYPQEPAKQHKSVVQGNERGAAWSRSSDDSKRVSYRAQCVAKCKFVCETVSWRRR